MKADEIFVLAGSIAFGTVLGLATLGHRERAGISAKDWVFGWAAIWPIMAIMLAWRAARDIYRDRRP